MGKKVDSVFNLSPPEKLQLVEDLWDDLASVPDEVPIHDWQKEELAGRKANLIGGLNGNTCVFSRKTDSNDGVPRFTRSHRPDHKSWKIKHYAITFIMFACTTFSNGYSPLT